MAASHGTADKNLNNGTMSFPQTAAELGSAIFRRRFGLKHAYAAGAMYRGIASPELVVRMGRARLLAFYGTGGLGLREIESGIRRIQAALADGEPYGVNLLANYANPGLVDDTVALYLALGVRTVEAAAFTQITPALVRFRASGLRRADDGRVLCDHRIVAKVSRTEVAEAFMRPAPAPMVQALLAQGLLTPAQAQAAAHVPMSHDLCIEADSGGHTDIGMPAVLFPAMRKLAVEAARRHGHAEPLCVGLAGGIGSPEAAACAFVLGADFILTGSVNQCTPEAATSDTVKRLLAQADIHDTDYAPAGDMFESGARVQVLTRGSLFAARANRLRTLYSAYESLEHIPPQVLKQLQAHCFGKSHDEIWDEVVAYLEGTGQAAQVERARRNPKARMALVFKWYFGHSTRLALAGNADDVANYQVHTGPALGAFNRWVKGTALEHWQSRHVDHIAESLMQGASTFLRESCGGWMGQAA